jgi:hypothetical protein
MSPKWTLDEPVDLDAGHDRFPSPEPDLDVVRR